MAEYTATIKDILVQPALTITAGSVKSYTLTVSALPTGVASCTVSRTSSPLKGASTGILVTAGTSQKTATIYYGDVLTISATASSGYNTPTASLSATTVTGNVTATITAGSVSKSWHTVTKTTGTFDGCTGLYEYSGMSGVSNIRVTVRVGDTTKTVTGYPISTSVSDSYTTTIDEACGDCGEKGYHFCPCLGEYVNWSYETTLTDTVYIEAYCSGDYLYIGNGYYDIMTLEVYK